MSAHLAAEVEAHLVGVLRTSQRLGFLGPGPVERHIDHARRLVPVIGPVAAGSRIAELGSGGGVPGLVLAAVLDAASWCFIEANQRRARFLGDAVDVLGWADRVEVWPGRAEVLGRQGSHRGAYDIVVARAFGPPAATAECGAPLLRPGGFLVVSEPPEPTADRWPADGLDALGLRHEPLLTAPDGRDGEPARAVRLCLWAPCPDRYPRRVGVPAKRPLF